MNDQSQVDFFTARTFQAIRQWPLEEQRNYLAGLLILIGDDPAVTPLRALHQQLTDAHNQIELFALGQLALNLAAE